MSTDKHSASPRHSRSSPSSSANVDVNSSVTVTVSSLTAGPSSQPSIPHSQSSHVLSSVTEHTASDDDSSLLFEDKSLWSSSFNVLYEFYQSGAFCDVEIHVGSQRINCHRLVLACFSQYFRYFSLLVLPFSQYFRYFSLIVLPFSQYFRYFSLLVLPFSQYFRYFSLIVLPFSLRLLSTRTPLVESDVFATQKVHQTMLQTHN